MSGNKKHRILEAVLQLINEKHEISNLKIADIAERANIGKGTIYEYFKNKDELLSNALVYMIENKIKILTSSISDKKTFKENYNALFFKISGLMDSHIYFIKCLFNEVELILNKALNEIIEESKTKIQIYFREIIVKLNKQGYEEGIISSENDIFDKYVALNNSISCLWIYKNNKPLFSNLSIEEVIDKSYINYIKLLNKN